MSSEDPRPPSRKSRVEGISGDDPVEQVAKESDQASDGLSSATQVDVAAQSESEAVEALGRAAAAAREEGAQADAAAHRQVIDLTDAAIASRTVVPGPQVSGRPPDLLGHHRLVEITSGDDWMQAEAFVYQRYRRIGYAAPSPRQRVEELARWSERSRFHVVYADDGRIVGTMRTIFGRYPELPVGQFERTDDSDRDPVCELSSMVVDESVRSSGVLEHLLRAGWAAAIREGASAIVALVDLWLLEMFRNTYGMPFVPIGRPHYHMGGDVVPVAMSLHRSGMAEIARNNPGLWLWSLEEMTEEEIARFDIGSLVPEDVVRAFQVS